MVSKQLRHASRIERKPDISESARTAGRDDAADWIKEHAADNWTEWTFSEIADETDYSRQHIANVVENYFQPTGAESDTKSNGSEPRTSPGSGQSLSELDNEQVPDWILEKVKEAYRDGYRDGFADGRDLT